MGHLLCHPEAVFRGRPALSSLLPPSMSPGSGAGCLLLQLLRPMQAAFRNVGWHPGFFSALNFF